MAFVKFIDQMSYGTPQASKRKDAARSTIAVLTRGLPIWFDSPPLRA
jgi:hypothetical protein